VNHDSTYEKHIETISDGGQTEDIADMFYLENDPFTYYC
jgi:hypothetical protein